MIAATIGKKFLKAYNLRNGTEYSAKEFFEKIYIPLFFDHPKYLMTGGNSPLENPKIQWKLGKYPSDTERKERIRKTINKIETSEADASIAIGFYTLDLVGTTSGQVTNLQLPADKDTIYASWIGSGLGVCVEGGLSIFFDKDEILLDLYEGWKIYRDLINKTPTLCGNQINAWNGKWLAHRYDSLIFIEDDPMVNFNPLDVSKEEGLRVSTQSWVKILIGISQKFDNPQLLGYVYNLGQTNTTIGFIPFVLPKIRKPIELYKKLFGENDYLLKHKQIEALFGTAFGFTRACQLGAIGVEALEPKGLREMITKGTFPNTSKLNEEKQLTFNIYIIWILAMLNNEQLWENARKIAEIFTEYTAGAKQGKTDRVNKIRSVLEATNKKQFIESLIPVVAESENKVGFEQIAKDINLMPVDNVPYFLTLIRFQYALIS